MRAFEITTPRVLSVVPETGVSQAIRLMLQNHVSGLLVIDAGRRLVGT